MNAQAQTAHFVERRKPGPRPGSPHWKWFLLAVTLALLGGYLIFSGHLLPDRKFYKPGDSVGYNLGLSGGLMMLIMLFYPVRKRFRFMKDRGLLPTWFRWHMVLGILGPALVMFHSTFVIHSVNAGVALVCMMLVSGSGIFGRFIYTKIHSGLYGRQVTLKDLQDEMARTGSYNRAFLVFAPEIERALEQFRARAEQSQGGLTDFVSTEWQARTLTQSLPQELHRVMRAQAHENHWDTGSMKQNLDELYEAYATHIRTYIVSIRNVAQYRTYARLLALWHIFHIPLVYMLVFSGIYHVIAVHMY